jgi:ribonuclease T2
MKICSTLTLMVSLATSIWCQQPLQIHFMDVGQGVFDFVVLDSEGAPQKSQDFAYYMLVLSYAPDFCAEPGGNKTPQECGSGRHVGFVVHGLWPQGETDRGPENCGGSPVATSIVNSMLSYIPTKSLIQHEWTAHGTCSGLSAADYFALVRKARDSVQIPSDYQQPSAGIEVSPADFQSKFASANPSFPTVAFRTSCYKDSRLEEARICFTKDLVPRACGVSAGECDAPKITLLPVR